MSSGPVTLRTQAGYLRVGDTFQWCGRWVTVERVERVEPHGRGRRNPSGLQRLGIRIWVTVNGDRFCLHYYADERVEAQS